MRRQLLRASWFFSCVMATAAAIGDLPAARAAAVVSCFTLGWWVSMLVR